MIINKYKICYLCYMKTTLRTLISAAMAVLVCTVAGYGQDVKTIRHVEAADKTAYFSFETGRQVSDGAADWDIAFNRTSILVNGGSSGKGMVTAVLLKETAFDQLAKRPESGFRTDMDGEKAIPTGSGNGWYEYNMANHSISPIPNRVIVFKTLAGEYVKLEVLGYYHDTNHSPANYSFRYSFL